MNLPTHLEHHLSELGFPKKQPPDPRINPQPQWKPTPGDEEPPF